MATADAAAEADRRLLAEIDAARGEALDGPDDDRLEALIREVISGLEGDLTAVDLRVYGALEGLARYIHRARAEIAALRPDDIRTSHIPAATDELDAVVGATEAATNAIMDACDGLTAVTATLPADQAAAVSEQVTKIFEACNFQDLTGQRITKVVRTLAHIEQRIEALIAAFGEGATVSGPAPGASKPPPRTADRSADPETDLLNGPAAPGEAIDQDEIDRLLASFD